jgi:hypothetical protein
MCRITKRKRSRRRNEGPERYKVWLRVTQSLAESWGWAKAAQEMCLRKIDKSTYFSYQEILFW